MSPVSDLVEFLRARLDDDEDRAKMARGYVPGPGRPADGNARPRIMAVQMREMFLLKFTPERMLAEVEAKRRIIDEVADEATSLDMQVDSEFRVGPRDMTVEPYLGDKLLRLLAQAYAWHEDYREEWRPDLTG